MPFSSDGEAIDFIYGVINWKGGATAASAAPVEAEPYAPAQPVTPALPPLELDSDLQVPPTIADEAAAGPGHVPFALPETPEDEARPPAHFSWEDGPLAGEDEIAVVTVDDDAGLADRLWAARETAEAVKAGEGRTRSALYQALSLAYDFALAAEASPADYVELLKESGVKAQARAPMTPIVKLVFGIDYDKARLTEFAAALCFAQRQQVGPGAFNQLIERQPGGLKAMVAAERLARRPAPRRDDGHDPRERLRSAPPLDLGELGSTGEFAVVVTRRDANGQHQPVAQLSDPALIERVLRKAA
jgi:hypothetical protein